MYYIYMLRCRDGSFYTGIAADIESACGSMRPAARPAPNTPAPTRRRRSRPLAGGGSRGRRTARGAHQAAAAGKEAGARPPGSGPGVPPSCAPPAGKPLHPPPHRAPPRLPLCKGSPSRGEMSRRDKGRDAGAQRLRGFRRFATAGCLRRPYLFRLAGKDRGEKGRLDAVWCMLRLNIGRSLCFSCLSTRWSPYEFFDYAPPDTGGVGFAAGCFRMTAVNRRCGGEPDGSYLLGGQIVRTKKENPMQKDAGQQIWPASSIYREYSNATATKSCSNVSGGAY